MRGVGLERWSHRRTRRQRKFKGLRPFNFLRDGHASVGALTRNSAYAHASACVKVRKRHLVVHGRRVDPEFVLVTAATLEGIVCRTRRIGRCPTMSTRALTSGRSVRRAPTCRPANKNLTFYYRKSWLLRPSLYSFSKFKRKIRTHDLSIIWMFWGKDTDRHVMKVKI